MKTNLIKKLFAGAVVAATLVSSAVMANAYKDTSFPYSNDFEHWGVASWNFWLVPSYDTGLGATAWGSDSTLAQIVADEDPAHNLAFYMSRPASDPEERFIYWLLPAVSEGKYVLEFDAKVTGNGMWFTGRQENHIGSGESTIMAMSNNSITSGGTVVSTYEIGEWKSFKMLFDVETGDVTTFVDGESATVNDSLFKTARAMYFVVNADATMSLDNIKTYLVDDSINPNLVLEENGEAVGAFADENADSFVLSLDNGEFGALPEVLVTCLGEDIMSDSDDYDFEVTTQLSDGKVIITPEDYLEVGSRYAVTVADGTTDLFNRAVNTTPIVFEVAENDGWIISVENNDDFENETTASIAPGGRFGNDRGDGWKSWAWVGGTGGSGEVLESGDYSGGKAVKLTGYGQLQFGPGINFRKGRLHFETKMDIGTGTQLAYDGGEWPWCRLFHGQSIDITGDSVADNTVDFMYQGTETQLWDNWKLKTALDTIEYTMDFDNLKSDIVFNGEEFEMSLPVTDTLNGGGYDYLTSGKYFKGFRILANELIIDYFNLYHEYTPALVKSIEATDVADGKVDAKSQIVISFSESVNSETLANITVNAGAEAAAYTGVWDEEALTYTLTFDSKLKGETEYTVTVPETVTDLNNFAVATAYGTFKTAPIPPMDVENLAAVKNGAEVTVTADVTNAVNGKVYLAIAGYKTNQMKDMNFVAVDVTEDSTQVSYTFTLADTDVDTVKAFALKDMATITPYCTAVEAK